MNQKSNCPFRSDKGKCQSPILDERFRDSMKCPYKLGEESPLCAFRNDQKPTLDLK